MIKERLELSIQRISEIENEQRMEAKYQRYFQRLSEFLLTINELYNKSESGELLKTPVKEQARWNKEVYSDLECACYKESFANPTYAVSIFGRKYGQILSAVYAEMYSLIPYCYEKNLYQIVIRLEWFLEFYNIFACAYEENQQLPDAKYVKEAFSSFAYDYLEELMEESVKANFSMQNTFARDIILNCNLDTTDYLYAYGEYITDNELKMSAFMAALPQSEIDKIADTFTEGYRLGFLTTGKDISIKRTVNIRYFLGFERVVKASMERFERMGLETVIYRAQPSFLMGRSLNKNGYFSTIANKQFECDHEYDKALYFNNKYVNRKLEAYKNALTAYKKECADFGGPAVIECFGETPFAPINKKENIQLSKVQQKLSVDYMSKASDLLNHFVKGEERSFTIISFPIPEIGDNFKELFEETIKINTLDYIKYRDIQQTLINTLDKSVKVRIKGKGQNQTNLEVTLWPLQNPSKETIFENCVADVNIPVGEVFTSPVLQGTNGLLHVTEVFLFGLRYENLKLNFTDGMVSDYSCTNFPKNADNRAYIKKNLLHQHETLPMGEFAIGTNTTAYMVSKKYHIENIMPILIAEKTGPHFAVGDTCYSHEEELITYNPDGKAIVARENSVSALRHTDSAMAYLNCHTDITIPYDELEEITAIGTNAEEYFLIKNGRFVLNGLEELNKPFDE